MTNYEKLLDELRGLGMDYKWSKMFVKKLADDEKAFPMPLEQRQWAMERGFFPGRTELYGLHAGNERDYMPDYPYFMLHPLNHHFRIWVNDKLTLKYVLNSDGCEDTLPDYYLYVENDGSYTYLMDCPQQIAKDGDFLWNLLKYKKILAMKPNSGTSGGLGFIKLELRDGVIFENNRPVDKDWFLLIRDSMRNYIVTEYVRQHHELAQIWPDSECTLRVIMCKDVQASPYAAAEWTCVVSFARFGTSVNGGASNLSSGGVGVGFDFETGRYNASCVRYKKFCPDGVWRLDAHPDTKALGVPWPSQLGVRARKDRPDLSASFLAVLPGTGYYHHRGRHEAVRNQHPPGFGLCAGNVRPRPAERQSEGILCSERVGPFPRRRLLAGVFEMSGINRNGGQLS